MSTLAPQETAPMRAPSIATAAATVAATAAPTAAPTGVPTAAPTGVPTAAPTAAPTGAPTGAPTAAPTGTPTAASSVVPSAAPSASPSAAPSTIPSTLQSAPPESDNPATSKRATEATPTAKSVRKEVSAMDASEKFGSENADEDGRAKFSNQTQFILSCVGFAVGLGNIWRFPKLIFDHGGGAFMVAYLICTVFFGLPLLYLEVTIGQYVASGPSVLFQKYMPAMEGLGWSMAISAMLLCTTYTVLISWILLYIIDIIIGRSQNWTLCGNHWNSQYCVSSLMDEMCDEYEHEKHYFNGSCYTKKTYDNLTAPFLSYLTSPAEEYFDRQLLGRTVSTTITSFSVFNWPVALILTIVWMIAAFSLLKSIKSLGTLSYLTFVPYVIVVALLLRGMFLEGSGDGMAFLVENHFDAFTKSETWSAALEQVCFSLTIGYGGLLTMSSYNPHNKNTLRDCIIIVVSDTVVSVIGALAVFSVMGFLANERSAELKDVVKESTALAFIAYPEAMARMPVPWLWNLLFFLMLFLLGTSSLVGLTEVLFTCIQDSFPATNKYKWAVCLATGVVMSLSGLIMCFDSAMMWFSFLTGYSSFAVCVNALLEVVVVIWIGGINNYMRDLRIISGRPTNLFTKIFGSSGYWIYSNLMVTAPLMTIAVAIFTSMHNSGHSVGHDRSFYLFPDWTRSVGWAIEVFPLMMIPIFFVINLVRSNKEGKPLFDLFHMHPTHPSFNLKPDESRDTKTEEDSKSKRGEPSEPIATASSKRVVKSAVASNTATPTPATPTSAAEKQQKSQIEAPSPHLPDNSTAAPTSVSELPAAVPKAPYRAGKTS